MLLPDEVMLPLDVTLGVPDGVADSDLVVVCVGAKQTESGSQVIPIYPGTGVAEQMNT